ncbi:putative protein OS=Streptomyces aurantiogriseus OX=66870 GN=GCM10010251_36300 PE=4 SV=1 [Streptomyces aurantiogriseus]|uniref:Uncharacterized protein n=1 Tax=Streptomyces aurantiogriseus TaxID=66870 RepID=A0A918F8Y3_9ACTN|nr:hypothetical protein GCM10010251_36300 [Streptomyces aurantiogriseus]
MGVPVGAPDGAPEGAPDGAPLGIPDGAWHSCCPDVPLFVADESPEPQATSARGESASRATAGTRRTGLSTRFMRNSSKEDEGVLRCGHSTNGVWGLLETSLFPSCQSGKAHLKAPL